MEKLALSIGNFNVKAPGGVPEGKPGMAGTLIQSGINILLVLAIFIALLFLVWGGLDYITSEGQKDKVQRAKRKISFAVLGLGVAFLAFLIISFIQSIFGVNLVGTG